MSFCSISSLDQQNKSFFGPQDLIKLEKVSKSLKPASSQWKKLGYEDRIDFLKIYVQLSYYADERGIADKRTTQEFLMNGSLSGIRAKEILKQDNLGLGWCVYIWGMHSIVLGILKPYEISEMECYQRQWSLSENGIKLMKNKLLTSKQIGEMHVPTRHTLLCIDKATQLVIDGTIKVDEVLKFSGDDFYYLLKDKYNLPI